MCGIHWYREQMINAEGDKMRLCELMKMIADRYMVSHSSDTKWKDDIHPDIIRVYKEITLMLETAQIK